MENDEVCTRLNFYVLGGTYGRRKTISHACRDFCSIYKYDHSVTVRHNLKMAEKRFFADTSACKQVAIIDLILTKEDQDAERNLTPANVSLNSFSTLYFVRRFSQSQPRCNLLLLGPDHIDIFRTILQEQVGDLFYLLPHRNLSSDAVIAIFNLFRTNAWSEQVLP